MSWRASVARKEEAEHDHSVCRSGYALGLFRRGRDLGRFGVFSEPGCEKSAKDEKEVKYGARNRPIFFLFHVYNKPIGFSIT